MAEKPLQLRQVGPTLEIPVRLQPRARSDQIAGLFDGSLKVRVSAPPVDEKANRALVQLLAKMLRIPPSRVAITGGHASRNKVVRVEGVDEPSFLLALEAALRRTSTGP